MNEILEAIQKKFEMGYSNNQLEVDFGYPNEESETEGFYLSKLNGWGAIPITEVLATKEVIIDEELIKELDKLKVAYCF
jgi:hypothetical protein